MRLPPPRSSRATSWASALRATLVQGVSRGVDMFDCVLPTRNARNAQVFTWSGAQLKLRNARFQRDFTPIDAACRCFACKSGATRAYLRHLFSVDEITALTLATIHNLTFIQDFMARIRASIEAGTFASFAADWSAREAATARSV